MTKSAKQRQILTGGRWAETTAGTRKGAGGRASQDEGPRQSGGGGSGGWGRVEEGGWPGEACGTAVPRGRGGQADQGAAGSNQETPRALSAAWSSSRIARSGGSESLCRLAPLSRGAGPRASVICSSTGEVSPSFSWGSFKSNYPLEKGAHSGQSHLAKENPNDLAIRPNMEASGIRTCHCARTCSVTVSPWKPITASWPHGHRHREHWGRKKRSELGGGDGP